MIYCCIDICFLSEIICFRVKARIRVRVRVRVGVRVRVRNTIQG